SRTEPRLEAPDFSLPLSLSLSLSLSPSLSLPVSLSLSLSLSLSGRVCLRGQVFSDCVSSCPASCSSPLPPASGQCREECVGGCECPPGLFLQGGECLKREDCPCFHRRR